MIRRGLPAWRPRPRARSEPSFQPSADELSVAVPMWGQPPSAVQPGLARRRGEECIRIAPWCAGIANQHLSALRAERAAEGGCPHTNISWLEERRVAYTVPKLTDYSSTALE